MRRSLHLVASIPDGTLCELSVVDSPLANDLLTVPFSLVDGQVAVPSLGNGLGVAIDEDLLARYRVG